MKKTDDVTKIKVAILEDNRPLIHGMRFELEQANISVCGFSDDLDKFLESILSCKPDVAIVDLRIWNDFDAGFEAILKAKEASPLTKIIVYTAYDDPKYFHKSINLGIKGFLAKTSNEISLDTVIRIVANGGTYFGDMLDKYLEVVKEDTATHIGDNAEENALSRALTMSELEILRLLDQGLGVNAIAEKKTISPHTVKAHTSSIRRKLGADSTANALRLARLRGVLDSN